jgi:hypothetical protein
MKVGKTISRNLMKVHCIPQSFSWSKTFGFYEISSHFVSLMDEIFCFTSISQILTTGRHKIKSNYFWCFGNFTNLIFFIIHRYHTTLLFWYFLRLDESDQSEKNSPVRFITEKTELPVSTFRGLRGKFRSPGTQGINLWKGPFND